jgi:hypothetical protein
MACSHQIFIRVHYGRLYTGRDEPPAARSIVVGVGHRHGHGHARDRWADRRALQEAVVVAIAATVVFVAGIQ